MELLRHLRYFVAVAEELHFARAAERLHIEQSPLSRAIKELEFHLGYQLFERDRHRTRLTLSGEKFLQGVRRTLLALDQAIKSGEDAARGYRGELRIAVSDLVAPQRLSELLETCREEEPDVAVQLRGMPFAEQLKGLENGLFDAGFAHMGNACDGIHAYAVWHDPMAVAMPARHPLLARRTIELADMLRHPLVLPDSNVLDGTLRQIRQVLNHAAGTTPLDVVASVSTFDLMLALVAAGYGLGISTDVQLAAYRHAGIVSRPLAGTSAHITTYLLRPMTAASPEMDRFSLRAHSLGGRFTTTQTG